MRVFWMMVFCAAIGVACGRVAPPEQSASVKKSAVVSTREFRANRVVTIGDSSYIRLNYRGNAESEVRPILGALDAFRRAFPDLEVTSWSLEKQRYRDDYDSFTYGIWVNHRSRSPSPYAVQPTGLDRPIFTNNRP